VPRNTATPNNEEIATWMQQGRAAMTINPYARLVPLLPPMAGDLAGKVAFAPTVESSTAASIAHP
jgi:multiple sugar transport system substrate-binding protein